MKPTSYRMRKGRPVSSLESGSVLNKSSVTASSSAGLEQWRGERALTERRRVDHGQLVQQLPLVLECRMKEERADSDQRDACIDNSETRGQSLLASALDAMQRKCDCVTARQHRLSTANDYDSSLKARLEKVLKNSAT